MIRFVIILSVLFASNCFAGKVAQIWVAGDDSDWRLNVQTAIKIEKQSTVEEYSKALQVKRTVEIDVALLAPGKMVALVDAKGKALRVFMIPYASRPRFQAQEMKFIQKRNGDIVGRGHVNPFQGIAIPQELHEVAHKRRKPTQRSATNDVR